MKLFKLWNGNTYVASDDLTGPLDERGEFPQAQRCMLLDREGTHASVSEAISIEQPQLMWPNKWWVPRAEGERWVQSGWVRREEPFPGMPQ